MPPTIHPALSAPGSFRDPQGFVITSGERVFRALIQPLAEFPSTWSDSGPLADLQIAGKLVRSTPRSPEEVPAEVRALAPDARGFLEHQRVAPITYPYEWPFALLKRAALLHLDVHSSAINAGLTLSDGSAFNVQFVGTRPLFIDALAFMPLVEGEPWSGYSQFCESFLNPLVLAASGCDAWVDLYRGRVRGISVHETSRQIGLLGSLRHRVFIHVYLHALLEGRQARARGGDRRKGGASKAGLEFLLRGLRRSIERLQVPHTARSEWVNYEGDNGYSPESKETKVAAVTEYISRCRPRRVVDLGSNAGEYAEAALEAGAGSVVGLERDSGSLERAVVRADSLRESYLPLQGDFLNCSPSQGWALQERPALRDRISADGLLCLALVHHLVLGAGIPLPQVLKEICAWSARGIVEFVPADDPMATRLTSSGIRLLHAYDLVTFRAALRAVAEIVRETSLPGSGRVLFEYARRD